MGRLLLGIVLSSFILVNTSLAVTHLDSRGHLRVIPLAERRPGESGFQAEAHYREDLKRVGAYEYFFMQDRATARDAAVTPDQLDFSRAPNWNNVAAVQDTFFSVRDHRFFTLPDRPDFERRLSWLYPDDGCFARAALGGQYVEKAGQKRPVKLFVFGTLTVQTPNAPSGSVSWWYHVVPAVRVGAELYVIDPAINPKSPLLWHEWLATLSDSPDLLEVAVCDGNTYQPYDPCVGADASYETSASEDQRYFLRLEWNRLEELNRDPEAELGNSPPW